jgi:hypothetical protein
MWAGIVDDCLAGLHIFPHRLTGNHYRDFFLQDLPKLLEDVPVVARARMWYMRALAHFSRAVRGVHSNIYHDRRIGTGGPTAWPPRSPDLNPLDFYLWGYLNIFVCTAPVDNEEAVHCCTVDVCQIISSYPAIFEMMRLSTLSRVEAYIESRGGYLEHLL